MFLHQHPYPPFIPNNPKKIIVGTIPPPRFSIGKLFDDDVDFCYGSKHNLLWLILDTIYHLNLEFRNTQNAVEQRKAFLIEHQIGICDMVESCEREKSDASDLGMQNIVFRNLIDILKEHPSVKTILFMGGNSKNSPENLFRKQLREHGIKLLLTQENQPKTHRFILDNRSVKTISLISPSATANRSIGANPLYKKLKKEHGSFTALDFRTMQYRKHFQQ